jgi:hypothetical protein
LSFELLGADEGWGHLALEVEQRISPLRASR